MSIQKAKTENGRPLERGLLMNALGVIIRGTRSLYLILFSQLLGAEGFGIYVLAFAIQEFISKIAILGLNWGGKQVVGSLKARGNDQRIRATVIRILLITILSSAAVAFAMYKGAGLIAAGLGQAGLAAPLKIFAFGFPFLCGMYVLVYSFRPSLDMKYEMYVTSIIQPVSVLLIGVAALQHFRGVETLAWAHVASAVISFFAAIFFFNRVYPSASSRGPASIDWKMLVRGSGAMGGMELIGNLQTKIALLPMALFFPAHVIGVYGAASEIASLFRSAKTAFDPILMPIVQALYLNNQQTRLQEEVTRAVSWAIHVGLGLLGLIVLMPDALLYLFGKEFTGTQFSTVLIILATGQFINMSLGLSDGILAITSHARVSLLSSLILLVMEIALLFLLIPVFGLTGAALATGFAFVAVSVFRTVLTRRLLGIRMLDVAQAKIVFLWAGCLAAALLLPAMLGQGSTIYTAVSVVVFLAMYVAISMRLPTGHGASYRPQCS